MAKQTRIDPERVRELAARGMTDREIGNAISVRQDSVCKVRRRHGIPAVCIGLPKRLAGEAAKKLSATKRSQRRYSPECVAELAKSGMTDVQIAAELGVCTATVRNVRQEVGVPAINRVSGSAATKRESRSQVPRAFGLPGWLTESQTRVLLALASGPLTAKGIRNAIGHNGLRINIGVRIVDGRPVALFQELIHKGLIDRIDIRRPGCVRGSSPKNLPSLFALTAKAMNLLAADPKEAAHG